MYRHFPTRQTDSGCLGCVILVVIIVVITLVGWWIYNSRRHGPTTTPPPTFPYQSHQTKEEKEIVTRGVSWYPTRCSRCNGDGFIRVPCSYCRGHGYVYDACRSCLGRGYAFDRSSQDWRSVYGWQNNVWGLWSNYGGSVQGGELKYDKCPECRGVGRSLYRCPYCDSGDVYVTCPVCKGSKIVYAPLPYTSSRIIKK